MSAKAKTKESAKDCVAPSGPRFGVPETVNGGLLHRRTPAETKGCSLPDITANACQPGDRWVCGACGREYVLSRRWGVNADDESDAMYMYNWRKMPRKT